ncbi:SH3 domain-containing protein [Streptomyces sp. NPDC004042]|uniref:SH3 domain-containing protein n=1 Tax=Streptomyces sp. NPDC004042 TaxID=3154451 RepID=UPI0033B75FD6
MLKKSIGLLGASLALGLALTGTATAESGADLPGGAPAASTASSAVSGRFYVNGVNIRNKPNLDATVNGLGYVGHTVTVYCFTTGPLETAWWRITDTTTGVPGYIEQSYGGPNSPLSTHC